MPQRFLLHTSPTYKISWLAGWLHSLSASSILTFLLQQELCCSGHFLCPLLRLPNHHFFFAGSFLSVRSHPCAGSHLFVISGRNNFSLLASSNGGCPHPAHKLHCQETDFHLHQPQASTSAIFSSGLGGAPD